MGSGISACTSATSVGVSDSTTLTAADDKNKSGEHAHSDSCDSGISVTERSRQTCSRSARARNNAGHQHVLQQVVADKARCKEEDEEEEEAEEGVPGNEIGVGTDSLGTPRPADARPARKAAEGKSPGKDRHHSKKPLSAPSSRRSPQSAPNLLQHAIDEEVEEEPEDKRLRSQRPPRPKSAHFRKSRAQLRSRTPKSRQATRKGRNESGDNSSDDLSSEDDDDDNDEIYEDDFDSDMLSIPDETVQSAATPRPKTLTTVKLGPCFHDPLTPTLPTPAINDHLRYDAFFKSGPGTTTSVIDGDHNLDDDDFDDEEMDWWRYDGCSTARQDGSDTARSGGTQHQRHHADSVKSNVPSWRDGRVSKKASERSISSIFLTTAVEPDTPCPFPATTTNPACFAVTNPEITQHILKSLQEIEQELKVANLTLGALDRATLSDYIHVVASLTPRVMHLLGDFKMATGESLGRLPVQCKALRELEESLARRLMALNAAATGPVELTPLLTRHLQDIEELCQREATVLPRVLLVQTQAREKHGGIPDKQIVDEEDEYDSLEDSLSVPGVTASMNSARPRKNIRRPAGDRPATSPASPKAPSATQASYGKSHDATAVPPAKARSNNSEARKRPDSGIVVTSCSASNSSSEALREPDADLAAQAEWIATSLEMLEEIVQVRTESHETIKSLVAAITVGSTSDKLKAHALYRWLASQSLPYYRKCTTAKPNSPTSKLRQLAESKISYATLYQEMASAAGLKCEKIDGHAKGPDYRPGTSLSGPFKHSWNAVLLGDHYHFVDAGFGALPCKFFVEHFFMTPPDEMRLSHLPHDKRWLLMTQHISLQEFEGTLKTWPTMFAFNIRPLNLQSVLRSYDGRLSITVLLRNVAVSPQLEYVGPGPPKDVDALAFNIDQEIRNVDNAETFHLNLPEEGTYYFTLMVHDLEDGEDVPAFQYRVEYRDELL